MKVLLAFVVNALFNLVIGLAVAKYLGPAEYGRFALAVALGLVLQAAALDWLRLSAIRFYSQRSRAEAPDVRATLDLAFGATALALAGIGATVLWLAGDFGLSHALVGLALAACVANGLFDYSTGLVRAAFNDGAYARLVLTKNALSLVLTVGGAFWFGSAVMALLGAIVSMVGSLVVARGALADRDAVPAAATPARARQFFAYAAPVVAANLLYLAIPFLNRTLAAKFYGFAETGQFSLAFDLGLRGLQAVGSALDVLLFQLAVAARDAHGPAAARAQIGRNMTIVLAVILPAALGIHMVLPSIEAVAVPAEFRGPFAHYLNLMLPGLTALALIQYAINPIFQIEKRTGPVTAAALAGALGAPLFFLVLPRQADASGLALSQSCAYGAALAFLIFKAHATGPQWPGWRDLAAIAAALAVMWLALAPMRAMEPGLVTLAVQVCAGAGAFGAVALGLDIAGLRGPALDWARRRRRRLA